jgi:RNA polymerase sigma-70 factor (ECF subfamily)
MLKEAGTITRPRIAPVPIRADRTAVAAHALRIARRTALGVLGDHATADVVAQEVAITVLRRIDDLRDPAALDAWVHRIAVRRAIREARRSTTRRAAEIAGHELHERTAPVDDPTAGDELDGALAVLEGLPARQRAALTLRYVHDLDDGAIATALGCRTGTVRSLLSRGREALRTSPAVQAADQDPPPRPPAPGTRLRPTRVPDRGAESRPTTPDADAPSRPVTSPDQEDPSC